MSDPRERTTQVLEARPVWLGGVALGVVLMAIGMAGLYAVIRSVGIENGGSCASGGPYEIAPGHECGEGVFALGFGGAAGAAIGCLLLLWSAHRYAGPLLVTSASGAAWGAFNGALGGSFLSVHADLPAATAAGSDFQGVGIMFAVFAVVGVAVAIGPVIYAARTTRLDVALPTGRAWLAWFATVLAAAAAGVAIGALLVDAA